MNPFQIPIYQPEITVTEKEYVLKCLESTWISSRGQFIDQFEDGVGKMTGVKNAIAVFNGTVALHLALEGLGIGPGDEVIVPDFSYIASSNAIHYVGAKPVFVDVSAEDWNITLAEIKANFSPRTRAIIFVNIYGLIPREIHEIQEFARSNDIWLIEDAAESIGATAYGKPSGSFGDIATFSFFGNKTITTGEGGMVTTKHDDIARKIRKLKNQGNSDSQRYFHDLVGYNYRMTNIQAALGCAQLERIQNILENKRNIFEQYHRSLSAHFNFQKFDQSFQSSHWMNGFLCHTRSERSKLEIALKQAGIETRPFFIPMSRMPFNETVQNPVSTDLNGRGILLPSYHTLSQEQLDYIIEIIIQFIEY